MTQPHPSNPPFPSIRGSLIMMIGGGLMLALVAGALVMLGRTDQLAPAAASLAGCLLAAVIALEPVRRASGAGLQHVPMAALASSVLRLALAGAAVSAAAAAWSLPVVATALWAMVWYLVLLGIEVTLIYQYVGACTARAGAGGSTAAPRIPENPAVPGP